MRCIKRLALIAGLCGAASVAQADVLLFVNAAAGGANNGTSWQNAYSNLKDALTAAAGNGQPTEIWVAAGTYKPGATRTATFNIPTGVRLLGGFAGGETLASQRSWKTNESILSGEIGNDLTPTDNVYHVLRSVNTDAGTLVDGFTIAAGYANGTGDDANAALVLVQNGTLRVQNCRLRDGYAATDGGAIMAAGSAAVQLAYCDFYNCGAGGSGGALRVSAPAESNAVGCRFLTNHAGAHGGAVTSTSANARFGNCVFIYNSAGGFGGAAYFTASGAQGTLRNCTLSRNSAGSVGGISVQSGATATVANAIFWQNTDTDPATTNPTIEALQASNGGVQSTNYSMVNGWNGAWGGVGNFSGIPSFVRALGPDQMIGTLDDDLRLTQISSGVDRGDNASAPRDDLDLDGDGQTTTEVVPFDAAGNSRVQDLPAQSNYNGSPIDIGAYEAPRLLHGDMNCDGAFNNFDIDPFVLAITDPSTYHALYPDCDILHGDINNDADFNNFDIDPFVMCIQNLSCP